MYNDHGARNLCLQTGRWTGVDELAHQYWETSPFVAMGNNPVKFVDLDGREIDVSHILKNDKKAFKTLIKELNKITGLKIREEGGKLIYKKNSSGAAVFSKSGTSQTARNALIESINDDKQLKLTANKEMPSRAFDKDENGKNMSINLNFEDIQESISGLVGVDKLTDGIGMTFFHEIGHTGMSEYCEDVKNMEHTEIRPGDIDPNGTVAFTNIIRGEMGEKKFGQEMSYPPYVLYENGVKVNYIPFNQTALEYFNDVYQKFNFEKRKMLNHDIKNIKGAYRRKTSRSK